MKVDWTNDGDLSITLDAREALLLRGALERATFVDTPVSEQPAILAFCEQVLASLPRRERGAKR